MLSNAKVRVTILTVLLAMVGWTESGRATTLYSPLNGDNRGYTGGTWGGSGAWRAECAGGEISKGLSRWFTDSQQNPGFVHGLWCYGDSDPNITPVSSNNHIDLSNGDSRFSPTYGSDWDPGYYKGECNNYERLSGISQNSSGQVVYGQCVGAVGWPFAAEAGPCRKVIFTTQDDRSGSSLGGEWDSGFDKNQCADDEAIKGFSIEKGDYSNTWKIRSIYCCQYTINY